MGLSRLSFAARTVLPLLTVLWFATAWAVSATGPDQAQLGWLFAVVVGLVVGLGVALMTLRRVNARVFAAFSLAASVLGILQSDVGQPDLVVVLLIAIAAVSILGITLHPHNAGQPGDG